MKKVMVLCLFCLLGYVPGLLAQPELVWQPTKSKKGFEILCLYNTGNELYAGIAGVGIHKTSDGGETWEVCNEGLISPFPNVILQKGRYFFTGTQYTGVFRSEDKGKTWREVNNGLKDKEVWSMGVYQNLLLAGTSRGIFVSEDDGENWSAPKMEYLTGPNKHIYSILTGPNWIIAGSSNKVFVSRDAETWEEKPTGSNLDMQVLLTKGNRVFLGSSGDGLLYSDDFGQSWIVDTTFQKTKGKGNINTIIIAEGTEKLLSGTVGGIWEDNDRRDEGLPEPQIRALAQHGNTLYAGTPKDGVWKLAPPQEPQPLTETTPKIKTGLFPNPAEVEINLLYELEESQNVLINLHKADGSLVRQLMSRPVDKGRYSLNVNVSDLQSGIYYCAFHIGDQIKTHQFFISK